MRNPADRDCSYYYEDFNRGADIRQCRIARAKGSDWWRETDCAKCPVPGVEAANGSPHLDLTLRVSSGRFGFRRTYHLEAWCVVHGPVEDPYVGCLECLAAIET